MEPGPPCAFVPMFPAPRARGQRDKPPVRNLQGLTLPVYRILAPPGRSCAQGTKWTQEPGRAEMIQSETKPTDRIASPPIVPEEPVIDRVHLARMTLGDKR